MRTHLIAIGAFALGASALPQSKKEDHSVPAPAPALSSSAAKPKATDLLFPAGLGPIISWPSSNDLIFPYSYPVKHEPLTETVTKTVSYTSPHPMAVETALLLTHQAPPKTCVYLSTSTLSTLTATVTRGFDGGNHCDGHQGPPKQSSVPAASSQIIGSQSAVLCAGSGCPLFSTSTFVSVVPTALVVPTTSQKVVSNKAPWPGLLDWTELAKLSHAATQESQQIQQPPLTASQAIPTQSPPQPCQASGSHAAPTHGPPQHCQTSQTTPSPQPHQGQNFWVEVEHIWYDLSESLEKLQAYSAQNEQGKCGSKCHRDWRKARLVVERSEEALQGLKRDTFGSSKETGKESVPEHSSEKRSEGDTPGTPLIPGRVKYTGPYVTHPAFNGTEPGLEWFFKVLASPEGSESMEKILRQKLDDVYRDHAASLTARHTKRAAFNGTRHGFFESLYRFAFLVAPYSNSTGSHNEWNGTFPFDELLRHMHPLVANHTRPYAFNETLRGWSGGFPFDDVARRIRPWVANDTMHIRHARPDQPEEIMYGLIRKVMAVVKSIVPRIMGLIRAHVTKHAHSTQHAGSTKHAHWTKRPAADAEEFVTAYAYLQGQGVEDEWS
ncbi:hypothetical protein EG328_001619 [Venturia inaequalis]|uniref:Uncharacterized protein n=1 Tax=Venturia inaequalis TaxID=5025 RepID=A0A8H3Z957_VENIN|nr:hypothetical protein EG328_001619 [Venturia inaequalis]